MSGEFIPSYSKQAFSIWSVSSLTVRASLLGCCSGVLSEGSIDIVILQCIRYHSVSNPRGCSSIVCLVLSVSYTTFSLVLCIISGRFLSAVPLNSDSRGGTSFYVVNASIHKCWTECCIIDSMVSISSLRIFKSINSRELHLKSDSSIQAFRLQECTEYKSQVGSATIRSAQLGV